MTAGCSAAASIPRLERGDRRFESFRPDHMFFSEEFIVLYLTRNLEWRSIGELGRCPKHSVAMPSIAFVARRDMT